MKVKTKEVRVEDISQIEKKIIAEIDPQYFKDELEKTFRDVTKSIVIRGFRPGKAPRSMIEKLYGESIKEEVIHKIEKEFIEEYLEENKLEIVSKIIPTHSENQDVLRFEYQFEVKPLIAPSNYRGIEVKGKEVNVTDEEVNAVINEILERYSTLKPKENDIVEKGDYVKFTIVSHKDRNMINQSLTIEIDENKTKKFILDALIGKKLKDEVEVNVAEGSEETMKIRIDEIKKIEKPELNDEFVKKFLQMDSVEALKKDIYNKLKERKENEEKEIRFDKIIEEIIAKNPFPVPPSMIESAIERYISDLERSSKERFSDEDRTNIANSIRDKITFEIQKYLIMEAIGKLEGIDVSDDDLEAHFKKMSDELGENVIKVKAFYEKNNLIEKLKEDLRFNKIKEFLIREAKILIE